MRIWVAMTLHGLIKSLPALELREEGLRPPVRA